MTTRYPVRHVDMGELADRVQRAADADDPRAAMAALLKPLREEHDTHRERLNPTCPYCTGDIT
jgi:hypothetical protein